ncbi:hypothetical protein CRT23_25875 [Methylobacterium sp. V23]|nr:hypothetical protein CRT23_25875 [Methylobacterium sp. V23]
MFRSMTALLALIVLVAAAPARRQPTPSSTLANTPEFDPVAAAKANQAAEDKTLKANAAHDEERDRKMKTMMGSIYQGC